MDSAKPAVRERRQTLRQKVHTPAYASFNGSSLALDLSEILDISESGVAIQTAVPLEVSRKLNLCLDLSDTPTRLQAKAEVVWTDSQGRAGLHLAEMGDKERVELHQWLLHNALAGCPGAVASGTVQPSSPVVADEPEFPVVPDYTSLLSALAAIAREVEALGPNLDAALQLVAERALAFTGATGAAIAFCEQEVMVCDAAAGADAPPVGARLQIGPGLSGECVRTGRLLRCDDSERDERADRETCRALGIRSMAVVPIRLGGKAIGILEVFSSLPNAFDAHDDMVLQRLAEIILAAVNRASRAHRSAPGSAAAETGTQESASPLSGMVADAASPMPRYQKILLVAVAITILLVLLFLASPRLPWQGAKRPGAAPPPAAAQPQPVSVAAAKTVAEAATLNDLRKLAEQGDPYAQFAVGARYATGEEVKQDYGEAVRWFTRAAEQGHVVAQATLGAYYWAGRGVGQDLSQACFWSILARAGGDEASKYRVAVLTSRMTRAQVVAAQQQADEWLGRHQVARSKPSAGR